MSFSSQNMQNIFTGTLASEASSLILDCASGELLPEGATGWHHCSGEQSFPARAQGWQEAHPSGSSQSSVSCLPLFNSQKTLKLDCSPYHGGLTLTQWHQCVFSLPSPPFAGTLKGSNALLTSLEINWPIQLYVKESCFPISHHIKCAQDNNLWTYIYWNPEINFS